MNINENTLQGTTKYEKLKKLQVNVLHILAESCVGYFNLRASQRAVVGDNKLAGLIFFMEC